MRNPVRKPVLIVDDDRPTRAMLSLMLEASGYTSICAPTAVAALREMEKQIPSIALVDLDLPGMGGSELVSELRRRHGNQIPVLVVTGLQRDDPRLPTTLDCDGWLTKPFGPQELLEAVSRTLSASALVS